MKRRAFIGLSGPLAYCYKRQSMRNCNGSPNPILEDSLGLLILYDELIFLNQELCPVNMRELPYVKFLSDREDYVERMSSVLSAARERYDAHDQSNVIFGDPNRLCTPALSVVTGQPFRINPDSSRFVPDNHGKRFPVGDAHSACGSSTWLQNVIADWTADEQFAIRNCEVISSSGNAVYYRSIRPEMAQESSKPAIGHSLVLRKLHIYLDIDGLDHPCLEELRNHPFLDNARCHIDEMTSHGTQVEVNAVAAEILSVARKARREVFTKHLQRHNEFFVIAKAGVKEGLGSFLPGSGFLAGLIEARSHERTAQGLRWAGFVADLGDSEWNAANHG